MTGPGGTTTTSSADQFTYMQVTSLNPAAGLMAGGTPVTITGTGFTGATKVDFGTTAATNLEVVSATEITVVSPPGTGTVDVTVTGPGGTTTTSPADEFTYLPAPAVTGISPAAGPTDGGTRVTITGTGFTDATLVNFGPNAATSVVVELGDPDHGHEPCGHGHGGRDGDRPWRHLDERAGGRVHLHDGGERESGRRADGRRHRGNDHGDGLHGATVVDFGPNAASGVAVNAAGTQITATSPAGTGTVHVTVTGPGGTTTTSPADEFTYMEVTGVSPAAGPVAGGTHVTITGTGFTGATRCSSAPAPSAFTINTAGTQITLTSPAGTGTVDITVTGPGGTTVPSPADEFTFLAAPAVTGVSPAAGPTSGGTRVTITGTSFTDATNVEFGTNAGTSVEVLSATQIAATSPVGSGTVDVVVTGPGGVSTIAPTDEFTYMAVTGVSPAEGPTSGGTPVTITGTGFTGATVVNFGTSAATNVDVVSAMQILATSPAGTGTVNVTVTGPGGTTATSAADQFTYMSVTGVSPATGSLAGGTAVTITGTGFTGVTQVNFGPALATSVVVVSATKITATSPAGTGTVDVTVTGPGGTTTTSAADHFAYTAVPAVTGVSPITGPGSGGTFVTITGTGFTGATAVDFGTAAATSVIVVNAGEITATSPAGTGQVDVKVTGPGGTSATSSADEYTYYSVTPDSATFNQLAGTGAGFTISGAKIGTPYSYTVTSTGGGTPVTGSGTISTATQDVTGIDLLSSGTGVTPLGNGTITFSVTLTDVAGDVLSAVTATATLEAQKVPAFTVTPDASTYTAATAATAGFTMSPAQVGDTYTYYFLLDGSPQMPDRGTGTINGASMHVMSDMSELPSGHYTLHVIEDDPAGNALAENAPVELNLGPPIFSITPTSTTINALNDTNAGFAFIGAEMYAVYNYTVTSSGNSGATSVSGSGTVLTATQQVTGINVSSLPDGTLTYSVTLTDLLGNISGRLLPPRRSIPPRRPATRLHPT